MAPPSGFYDLLPRGGGDEAAPGQARRGGSLAAACVAAVLFTVACWSLSGSAPQGSAASGGAFLGMAELPEGVGGCDWGVHCEKVDCCTEAGYSCVYKTKWWSECERHEGAESSEASSEPAASPATAAPSTPEPTPAPAPTPAPTPAPAPVAAEGRGGLVPVTKEESSQPAPPATTAAPKPSPAPAPAPVPTTTPEPAPAPAPAPAAAEGQESAGCGEAGDDCTESKCCKGQGYECTKRTDGMWWKSSCVKPAAPTATPAAATPAPAPAATPAPTTAAPPAAPAPPLPQGPTGSVQAQACGDRIPFIKDVKEKWKLAEQCSRRVLNQMSLEDKVLLLHGSPGGMGYAGYIKVNGVEGKQGVVRLTFNDGPQGYNGYAKPTWSKGTQFPDLIAVAASFDPATAASMGAAIAEEFRTKGCSVLLGPDVEVVRTQNSGRSFESLSGEDPYLGRELARAYVREVQKRGLIATVKHWLDNNQEANRQELDVHVGARAQHEIYMLPFEGAIAAGAGAVMCSYNKVGGEYACGNRQLLRDLLRKDLGFRGFVISDWGAVHSGAPSAKGGLNIEMPEGKHFKNLGSELPAETIDELAGQVLSAVYASGQFHGLGPQMDWTWPPPYYQDATNEQHTEAARNTITSSTVLLKNADATLPLKSEGLHVVMVGGVCKFGDRATGGQGDAYAAGGSGYVATGRTVTPFAGLSAQLGQASVAFSEDGSGVGPSDVAVICAAAHSEEGSDRKDLTLPQAQELVDAVKKQGPKRIVVVAIVPGAVTTEWIDKVDAALVMFMPGEQVGAALARLLLGLATPGGRLPVSFPKAGEQRFTEEQYPGVDLVSKFSEDVLVGYRWNDAKGVRSAFPFGFGLSYTEFNFTNFSSTCDGETAKVSMTVSNVGRLAGHAVPQLYVGFKSLLPVLAQLRGFQKVHLPPGFQAFVTFNLGPSDWSFYNETVGAWTSALDLQEDIFVWVGSSSGHVDWNGHLECKTSASA